MSNFTDQTLTCKDCQSPFLFTARDQEFFAQQGFTPPKRCRSCRQIAKAKKEGQPAPQQQAQAPQPGFNASGGYSTGGYGDRGGGGGGGRRQGGGGKRRRDRDSFGGYDD